MSIEAEFTDTNVPAKLAVDSGTIGLTVDLEVLDGATQGDYLDFNDNTFKAAGWVTKSVALADVGGGRYSLLNGLDVSAMTIPAGTNKLILEYNVSGSITGVVSEELLLRSSTYQAKVGFFDDNLAATDRYTVVFYKNSEPITVGITTPTIQVIKASDGTDLVASVTLTQVLALGIFKHDEAVVANRIVSGAGYYARVRATIDGSLREWYQQVGRDS